MLNLCMFVCDSCLQDELLTCSNSSRSTSPSPLRSNILKAISKFLWGAGHHRIQTQTKETHSHISTDHMKTPCCTGSTQKTAKEFNTDSVITHQLCSLVVPPVVQHEAIKSIFCVIILIKDYFMLSYHIWSNIFPSQIKIPSVTYKFKHAIPLYVGFFVQLFNSYQYFIFLSTAQLL